MELLYAYAEKYRIFEHQEFSFSDKFRVHFDEEKRKLTIQKNENYFDLYPRNILGISAVVGKNAAGKTSLLSMIGDREERRDLTEGLETSKPERYFLIHWLGQDRDGRDIFLFETNEIEAFRDLFKEGTPDKESCLSLAEGREIFEFQCCGDRDLQIRMWYEPENEREWVYPVNMLFFRNGFDEYFDDWDRFGRREAPLVLHGWYRELEMLRDRIRTNTGRESMFGNDDYHFWIRIVLPTNPKPWSPFPVLMEKNIQKIQSLQGPEIPIFLAFALVVGRQCQMLERDRETRKAAYHSWFHQIMEMTKEKNVVETMIFLQGRLASKDTPDQQDFLFSQEFWEQLKDRKYIDEALIPMFRELMDSREQGNLIDYMDNRIVFHLDFRVRAETDISFLKSAFKKLQHLDLFEEYVQTEISPLSDGERENLAMYSSIHAQLVKGLSNSGSYTLLFDEIERCMHPEMCRCLISDLMEFLQGYPDKQFQIIIASHSPFIIGDLRQENLICLTKDGKVYQPEERPFGQNIHTLLKSQFFLDNTFSKYACDMISLVAECLSNRDKDGNIRWNSLEEMRKKISDKLGTHEEYPDKRLPSDDTDTLPFLEQIIGSVGEPLLRRTLQGKLEQWKEHDASLNWKQAEREALLKRLWELDEQLGDR